MSETNKGLAAWLDELHALTNDQRESNKLRSEIALENAKKILKPGDRLQVSHCPGRKRWITFASWDWRWGCWIVSKSGNDDYSPLRVDRLNGEPVDFCATSKV